MTADPVLGLTFAVGPGLEVATFEGVAEPVPLAVAWAVGRELAPHEVVTATLTVGGAAVSVLPRVRRMMREHHERRLAFYIKFGEWPPGPGAS